MDCCKDPENLVEVSSSPAVNQMDPTQKGKLIKRQCKVCGRNHYELSVDPVKLGLKG
jgi:uncharacterized OB-fold protein